MVRAIYLTLAALLALACAASAAPVAESDIDTSFEYPASRQVEEEHNSSADSSEEHDDDVQKAEEESKEDDDDDDVEDDDDDVSLNRRRRDVATTQETPSEAATETPSELEKDTDTVTAAVPVAPSRKPVLVLIRDALKKVTTDLPTAQVANNALQYFQQFEHFIQQTIEQVIGDDYDDDDETPVTVIPNTDENKQPEAESPQEQLQQQPEKVLETAAPEAESVKPVEEAATPLSNAV